MIRFIDLGFQILDEHRKFAFFDTIDDTFECYNDAEVWGSWDEFEADYRSESAYDTRPLERYRGLFPDNWEERQEPEG